MTSDVDVYADLERAFHGLGVRWYLFGGQAAILHGATRFTEDIDVTVELAGLPPASLVAALREHGFALRVEDEDFLKQTRVMPLLHIASGMPVDLVLAGPGIEETFFDGVVNIVIEGQRVPVASAEDITVMKVLSGRPKDLDDVTAILAAQPASFDERRVRELLGLLEEALDQADLLPAFERCLARSRPQD